MKITDITTKIGHALRKTRFQIQKHSPTIMVTGGIVGVVVSGVLACRATLKASGVVETAKEDLTLIRSIHEMDGTEHTGDMRKELTVAYLKTGVLLAKLYLPAVGLGALSISGILGANHILNKRNAALAAAYATIEGGFKEYRARVVSKFGEEIDRELRFSEQTEKLEGTEIGEDGKTKKTKKNVQVTTINTLSDYARYYDFDTAPGAAAVGDVEYNMFYVKSHQDYANNLLTANGYLFLNDVYDMLGLERSIAGQVVGWVYEKDAAEKVGVDNYVDFGAKEVYKRDDHGNLVKTILLDFNVDGNIWERAAAKKLLTA